MAKTVHRLQPRKVLKQNNINKNNPQEKIIREQSCAEILF